MNKLTKGAIAGAAGIALLLGGAGTFALWNDSASVGGSAVTSGTLTIEAAETGSWYNTTSGTDVVIADIDEFLIVPGNTLKFTQDLTIGATGTDLKGELSFDPADSITGDLADFVETSFSAVSSDVVLTAAGADTWTFTPDDAATFVVSVEVTVELPSTVGDGDGNGEDAQDLSLGLSTIVIDLKQLAIQ